MDFYHLYCEVGDEKHRIKCYVKDLDLIKLQKYYIEPFKSGKTFYINGNIIKADLVKVFKIAKTVTKLSCIVNALNDNDESGIFVFYSDLDILKGTFDGVIDMTNELMSA